MRLAYVPCSPPPKLAHPAQVGQQVTERSELFHGTFGEHSKHELAEYVLDRKFERLRFTSIQKESELMLACACRGSMIACPTLPEF